MIRMDGQRHGREPWEEGREERNGLTVECIHYSDGNKCFIRYRGDINIHQRVWPPPPPLVRDYQCTASVCARISVFQNVSPLAWATRKKNF